jgi:hypothetical protein
MINWEREKFISACLSILDWQRTERPLESGKKKSHIWDSKGKVILTIKYYFCIIFMGYKVLLYALILLNSLEIGFL